MSVIPDQKEDLRLRMAELEKKLAESEEERCKLEKTCNVLMRAFREEEKMQYKALNEKYEKFLDDCSVRKRRNDIILRSLCRIEDRSRALYAKTERLKLLKDRYISYLNINDTKKSETPSQTWRTFRFSSWSHRITPSPRPKYVQWTTPLASHLKTEHRKPMRDALERNESYSTPERKSEETQRYQSRKASDVSDIYNKEQPSAVRDVSDSAETGYRAYKAQENHVPREITSEKETQNHMMLGNSFSENSQTSGDKKVIGIEPTEDFDRGIDDPRSGKLDEIADGSRRDSLTKQNKPDDIALPTWDIYDEDKEEDNGESKNTSPGYQEVRIWDRSSPEGSKVLPKGLDGVDYQDETYPESYYEQPVHQNHTSIASDVILEEDETEQEVDEEENFTPADNFRESQPKGTVSEPNNQQTEKTDSVVVMGQDEVKSREAEHSEGKQSDKSEGSERVVTEKSDKNKTVIKSNLIHLLESDSESFQIEHGDVVSGNEDSDFDFSFRQN